MHRTKLYFRMSRTGGARGAVARVEAVEALLIALGLRREDGAVLRHLVSGLNGAERAALLARG
jgi:hypothetical protein